LSDGSNELVIAKMPVGIGCSSYDVQYMLIDVSRPPEHDPVGLPLVLIAEQGWLQQQATSTRGAPLPVNLDETPVPVQSDQHLSPEHGRWVFGGDEEKEMPYLIRVDPTGIPYFILNGQYRLRTAAVSHIF
jgi:hypothetical protein